ncbi:integrative conjugative element protein, RAQPRD family [Pseudomonas gessardii]|uniref:Conjugal transfer protein n=1 Tax=Pseudomonas gessardii TaxID=78544 RepID=A0A7Y1MVC3_9PSED|nr:hypothetical protein [Pseudomonas gessardii]NNA98906.1 hypothetical protein [Pseudomonas gessardii]ONH46330.1 hypothetical protein BLL38_07225 [Pseudomonas gessardii]SDR33679.1 integrative conjugative element protein, RAQPRD family [Pseudomonas gessardii]
MIQHQHLTQRLIQTSAFTLLAVCAFIPHAFATSATEHSNLAVMIRQLNALEATAQQSAQLAVEPSNNRFFLDYQRLASDIERIRLGLENYLTPNRAQPRDTVEISGGYTLEREPTP